MKQQRSTMQHVFDVTGTQEPAPATACYETATFNDATCTGMEHKNQNQQQACYETATFNDATYLM
jgi:hypothetical protein